MPHLILSRKETEAVIIDVPPSREPQRVRVSVYRKGPCTVKLGIEAEAEVRVMREELVQATAAVTYLEPWEQP